MLVWATEFPAAKGRTAAEVLAVGRRWLAGSPHGTWKLESFLDDPPGEITRYECGGQTASFASISVDGRGLAGLQQTWLQEDQLEWTAEIVAREASDALWITVRLDCNVVQPGLPLPKARKPYIVGQLLNDLGGGSDAGLGVGETPVFLRETDVQLAAHLIRGDHGNRLPVVYASAGRDDRPSVDPRELARWLAGMAHVVVEPSRWFSFTLAGHAMDANAYGGAVGVYWPNGRSPQVRFITSRFASPRRLQSAVVDAVRKALTVVRPHPECTWAFLRECISRERLEALKAAGSTEVEKYVQEFDAEVAAKQERIDAAEREIVRLRAELRRFEHAGGAAAGGVLAQGKEKPLYPGELRDAAVKALRAGRTMLCSDGRLQHVVDDLLAANPAGDGDAQIEEILRECLSTERTLSAGDRAKLERAGFRISDDGKHWKATYQGDERYVFTMSKTSSDHRAGKNLVSQISRRLFK
jgi:hypothetical protein